MPPRNNIHGIITSANTTLHQQHPVIMSPSTTTKKKKIGPYSPAWLDAIQRATACIHRIPKSRTYNNNNTTAATTSSSTMWTDVEKSLYYLSYLEASLTQIPRSAWNCPPDGNPPHWNCWNDPHHSALDTRATTIQSTTTTTTTLKTMTNGRMNPRDIPPSVSASNPFAVFWDNNDDDSDDNNSATDEARDQIVVDYYDYSPDHHDDGVGMNILRLIVRLSTSQSDVLACKASMLAHTKQWTEGALALTYAIGHVRRALEMADAQISKWYETREDEDDKEEEFDSSRRRQADLMQDADIVHVCIQTLLEKRAAYITSARREIKRLQRRLRPQWRSRDEVRRRVGEARWTHNPHPKNDHAARRRADEDQLRALQEALALLLAQHDTEELEATAQMLRTRLSSSKPNRYNGQRPIITTSTCHRVLHFPDPTLFGWIFTGSADNVVEFFEKTTMDGSVVKLDFYFTTGTVKTSMDHPTQGKTQLFAKKGDSITPELFRQILENPRAHTSIRYHIKANRRRSGAK